MKTKKWKLLWILHISAVVLMIVSPSWAGNTFQEAQTPVTLEDFIDFSAILKEQGFDVEYGYLRLYTEADCPYAFEEMGTCYGNNPAAPYITLTVPTWPGEFIDPATDLAFGPNEDGFSNIYRLDPQEAIVIFGMLPPQAAYFGLQSYLFTRQGTYDVTSETYDYMKDIPPLLKTFFTEVPKNPDRIQVYASLSDSINHKVIEKKSGAAFDQFRYFIITPDRKMDIAIRNALKKISVQNKDIFTEPIPSDMILGLGKESDDFITVIRYAMPEDGGGEYSLSDDWRKQLPLFVLRVRDTSDRKPSGYPRFKKPEKRHAEDEYYLKKDLDSLMGAVIQEWGQPGAAIYSQPMLQVQLHPINMVGPKCTEIGMNCLLDTQDTSYQYSFPLFVGPDTVYAVIGTLGTRTGNATYVGLGLTSTIRMLGFDNLSGADLEDTASEYASTVNNTDKFFLYYFSRDCSGVDNCREISGEDIPPCDDPTGETCDKLSFSIRNYMPPGRQRGPDDKFIMPARVVPLQKHANQ